MERLAFPETDRVRDVREAPDGTLWFLSKKKETVYTARMARVKRRSRGSRFPRGLRKVRSGR